MFNGIHTMGTGDWVLMGIFWFALVAALVYFATRLFPTRTQQQTQSRGEPGQPSEVLERRLARGEIDVETYEHLRTRLGPPTMAGRG